MFDSLHNFLINPYHSLFLLYLLLKGNPQILNSSRYLHFFLAHHIILPELPQLHIQNPPHSLSLLHLLQQLAILPLKPNQLILDCLRHLQPLTFLSFQLIFHPLQLILVLFLHDLKRIDQLLDNFERFL